MVLRTTRQLVSVLGSGVAGKVRVTRQNVSVLFRAGVIVTDAEDTITWTDEAHSSLVYSTIVDTLVWTDEAKNTSIKALAVDTIVWSDEALVANLKPTIEDTWVITDEAIGIIASTYIVDSQDVLTWSDQASYTIIPEFHFAGDTLVFVDTADYSKIGRQIDDTLVWVDVATVNNTVKPSNLVDFIEFQDGSFAHGTITVFAEDQLTDDYIQWDDDTGLPTTLHYGLGQRLRYDFIRTNTITHHWQLEQSASENLVKVSATPKSAIDTIVWLQDANRTSEAISQKITFFDEITVDHTSPIVDILEFVDTVDLIKDQGFLVSDDFTINHSVTYSNIRGGILCSYAPAVGESTDPDAPRPPNAEPRPIIPQDTFQLFYPYYAPPDITVSLRLPDFGNKDQQAFQRVKETTRGGTLIVFADPIWPKVRTIFVTFSALYESEAQEVLDFIDVSLGQVIGLRDWNGQLWAGVIANPETPIVRDGRVGNSIALEVEVQPLLENLVGADTIIWADQADSGGPDQLINQTILWTDEAVSQNFISKFIDQTIFWADSLERNIESQLFAADTIIWVDTVVYSQIRSDSIVDTILWTDEAISQKILFETVVDNILWTDTADRQLIASPSIIDNVVWTDTADRQFIADRSASDTIVWTDEAVSELVRERFWVGISSWNSTSSWSNKSGGASGFTVPDALSDVTFDSGSVSGCTLDVNALAKTLTMTSAYTGTFAASTFNVTTGDVLLENTLVTAGSGLWTVSGDWDSANLTTWTRETSEVKLTGTNKTFQTYGSQIFYDFTVDGDILQGNKIFFVANDMNVNGDFGLSSAAIALNSVSFTSNMYLNSGGRIYSQGVGVFNMFNITAGRGILANDGVWETSHLLLPSPSTSGVVVPGRYDSTVQLRTPTTAAAFVFTPSAGAYRFKNFHFVGLSTLGGSMTLDCSTNAVTEIKIDEDFLMGTAGQTGTDTDFTVDNSGQTVDYIFGRKIDCSLKDPGSVYTWTKGNGTINLEQTTGTTIDFKGFTLEDVVVNNAFANTLLDGFTTDSYTQTNGRIVFGSNTVTTVGNFTITSGADQIGTDFNGCTIVVGGNFDVSGVNGDLLLLNATVAWTLTITGTAVADYVNVDHSNAGGGTQVSATNSTDGGNNTNWSFS